MDGEGTLYGHWIVRRVNERQTRHGTTGKPRQIEWTIGLVAAPDDDLIPL